MTPPKLDLARRAVACRGWRLMPGMRRDNGYRITEEDLDSEPEFRTSDILPDFSDPATLGCLLALVREAWGAPFAQVSPRLTGNPTTCDGWVAYLNDDEADRHWHADTEAEALVAALEAAHRRAGGSDV